MDSWNFGNVRRKYQPSKKRRGVPSQWYPLWGGWGQVFVEADGEDEAIIDGIDGATGMSYCFNPDCSHPQNPDNAEFCQACGDMLTLHERYRAMKLLGRGGFGRTFLGMDLQPSAHPLCVIKQCCPYRQNRHRSAKIAELFQREVEHLRSLGHHPQIPDLLNHFSQSEEDYLIQTYVKGQTLDQMLHRRGPFDEAQIRNLLISLLPVVQFIHNYQVVHRDIKPANVIQSDVDQTLVLVDFGASKSLAEAVAVRTGTSIGSAGFAAPEQVVGRATYASDLYGLGVTCLHLLTGIPPVDLFSFGEGRWVWQDYLQQPVSNSLVMILNRMVERDLHDRYPSASNILHDLDPNYVKQPEKETEFFQAFHVESLNTGWNCVGTLCGHRGAIMAIAMHPSGQYLASGGFDKTIQLWSLDKQQVVVTLTGHSEPVTSLTFNSTGELLVSGSVDDTIRIWDVAQGKLVRLIDDPSDSVTSLMVALCPLGQTIVSGSDDCMVRLWNVHTGKMLRAFQEKRAVTGIQFMPKGDRLVTSTSDNTLRIWDPATGECLQTLEGHSQDVLAFAIAPQGNVIVSGGGDNTVRLWNLKTQQAKTLTGHLDWVKSVALQPGGTLIASGSSDTTIRLWQWPEGTLNDALPGHTRDVNALAFTPDGTMLVSGSGDRTLKLWRC